MERLGGVADTFALITKMMDRSNHCLLNAIDDFEGWHARIEANPKAREPGTAICVLPARRSALVFIPHYGIRTESLPILDRAQTEQISWT
jgi:hypothetical protein